MKRGLLFHILIVLMLGLTFNFPLQAIAQQSTIFADAKTAAEYDAEGRCKYSNMARCRRDFRSGG